MFISKAIIVLTYVDDCLLIAKSEEKIKWLILPLREGSKNFDLTDKGDKKIFRRRLLQESRWIF